MKKTAMAFKADEWTTERVAAQMKLRRLSQSDVLRTAVFLGLAQLEAGLMLNTTRLAENVEYNNAALYMLLLEICPDKAPLALNEMRRRIKEHHMQLA